MFYLPNNPPSNLLELGTIWISSFKVNGRFSSVTVHNNLSVFISYLLGPGTYLITNPHATPNKIPIPTVTAIAAKSYAPFINKSVAKVGVTLFLAATNIAAKIPLNSPNTSLNDELCKDYKKYQFP